MEDPGDKRLSIYIWGKGYLRTIFTLSASHTLQVIKGRSISAPLSKAGVAPLEIHTRLLLNALTFRCPFER